MTFTSLITVLYAMVPVVSALGWVPQILRLVRNPELALGMSIPTWGLWTLTGLVGSLYGAFVVQDFLVTAVFAVNFAGQATILAFALAARMRTHPDT